MGHQNVNVMNQGGAQVPKPGSYQQATLSTVVPLFGATGALFVPPPSLVVAAGINLDLNSSYVYIWVEGNIRWTSDGSTPTTTVGIPFFGSGAAPLIMRFGEALTMKLVSKSGSVTVNIQLYN